MENNIDIYEDLLRMVHMVEGDSNLVIGTIKKSNYVSSWEKLSHSWRTTRLVQDISDLLPCFDYIIPFHVRREGNKIAYFLEKWG